MGAPSRRITLTATTMSPSLPPEMLDLVVDYLQHEPDELKSCCRVSKSWVPRTRKHLFAEVVFHSPEITKSWMKAFPDPSNSPAHYTRRLCVIGLGIASASVCTCILSFRRVEELSLNAFWWGGTGGTPLARLHGLSPNLKTLDLIQGSTPVAEILDLVCSFPLLNDLSMNSMSPDSNIGRWIPPATSPKLGGSLRLCEWDRSIAQGLLYFPDGLHFSKVSLGGQVETMDLGVINELLLKCSDTMKSLCVSYLPTGAFFLSSLLVNTLPCSVRAATPQAPLPINLSEAAKLKELELRWDGQDVRWITETLQTANSEVLHRITIFFYFAPFVPTRQTLREWHELDHLLVQLWTSRSIAPKIVYLKKVGSLPSRLLPELMKRVSM